jgi:hypothetical protein
MNGVAVVQSAGADTIPGKERRGGATECSARAHGGGREEKEKRGHGGDGAPFIVDTAGSEDGPRAVPCGGEG